METRRLFGTCSPSIRLLSVVERGRGWCATRGPMGHTGGGAYVSGLKRWCSASSPMVHKCSYVPTGHAKQLPCRPLPTQSHS